MKTTLELVHDLQALLSGPEKWTQGEPARRADGSSTCSSDPEACAWCLAGAFKVVQGTMFSGPLCELFKKAKPAEYDSVIWNDNATFADIQALMAKMEELARKEAA